MFLGIHEFLRRSLPFTIKDRINFCPTCQVIRPPRTKHCRYCNNCVAVFDHHCPWLGTCVGRRNYVVFICFITITLASTVYICAHAVLYIHRCRLHHSRCDTNGGARRILAGMMAIWCFVPGLLLGILLTFHLHLMGREQTTNEYLRGEHRPQDARSGQLLCTEVICSIMEPSRIATAGRSGRRNTAQSQARVLRALVSKPQFPTLRAV